MKISVCFVYRILFSVSLLSSCLLFILAAAAHSTLSPETTDIFQPSLYNATSHPASNQPVVSDSTRSKPKLDKYKEVMQPSPHIDNDNDDTNERIETEPTSTPRHLVKDVELEVSVISFDPGVDGKEKTRPPATLDITLSQNSGLSNGLGELGHPTVITLVDTTTQELGASIDDFVNISSRLNINVSTGQALPISEVEQQNIQEVNVTTEEPTVTEYIVKAVPKVIRSSPDTQEETSSNITSSYNSGDEFGAAPVDSEHLELQTVLGANNENAESMPVFSEWAQKQLEEDEKKKEEVNVSAQSNVNFKPKPAPKNFHVKHRSKNYASPDCGAKIIAANSESSSVGSILTNSRDEYALYKCTSRIWFVVELCEAIQAKKIDLANYELFSSSPKDFIVSVSARFPTRDWSSVGKFVAKDERDIQSFDLHPQLFGKFVKVEINSHYGEEHYCPISMFRVYGTSEFEAFETENQVHQHQQVDEEEEEDEVSNVEITHRNLFGTARDAVISIVKKAAEVLVKTGDKNATSPKESNNTLRRNACQTPSHIIVCDNCSDLLFSDLYTLMSSRNQFLETLIRSELVGKLVRQSSMCNAYGLEFNNNNKSYSHDGSEFLEACLSPKYVAALCNIFAIIDKKVVLNSSYGEETDITSNITLDKTNSKHSGENSPLFQSIDVGDVKVDPEKNFSKIIVQTEVSENSTEAPVATEFEAVADDRLSGQISPTKTITQDREQVKLQTTEPEVTQPVELTKSQQTPSQSDELSKVQNTSVDEHIETVRVQESNTSAAEDNRILENLTEESLENLELTKQERIKLDNLYVDLEQNELPPASTTISPPSSSTQNVPKEAVLVRMSNRIKVLERNMSLSGQYLEELSRRYNKQIEELQKTHEKSKTLIIEESRKRKELETKHSEEILALKSKLSSLDDALSLLITERNSWLNKIYLLLELLVMQAVLYLVVQYFFKSQTQQQDDVKVRKKKVVAKRRKSVEGVSGHISPGVKKRRPSTEAMNITGTYKELLKQEKSDAMIGLEDANSGTWIMSKADRKKNKRKHSRSNSNATLRMCQFHTSDSNIRRSSGFDARWQLVDVNSQEVISVSKLLNGPNSATNVAEIINIPDVHFGRSEVDSKENQQKDVETNNVTVATTRTRKSSPSFLQNALTRKKSVENYSNGAKIKPDWDWYRLKKQSYSADETSSQKKFKILKDEITYCSSLTDKLENNDSLTSSLGSIDSRVVKRDKKTASIRKMLKKVF